jgi:hypothetical protein
MTKEVCRVCRYFEPDGGGGFNQLGVVDGDDHASQRPAAATGRPTASGVARPSPPTASAAAHAVPPIWGSGAARRTGAYILEKEPFSLSQVPGWAQ